MLSLSLRWTFVPSIVFKPHSHNLKMMTHYGSTWSKLKSSVYQLIAIWMGKHSTTRF